MLSKNYRNKCSFRGRKSSGAYILFINGSSEWFHEHKPGVMSRDATCWDLGCQTTHLGRDRTGFSFFDIINLDLAQFDLRLVIIWHVEWIVCRIIFYDWKKGWMIRRWIVGTNERKRDTAATRRDTLDNLETGQEDDNDDIYLRTILIKACALIWVHYYFDKLY